MVSKPLSLVVHPRGKPIKRLPTEASLTADDSTSELFKSLAQRTGLSIHRLRVTKGSDGSVVPNRRDVRIQDTGLRDQSVVYVKDLGPQIAWRTVFVIEYAGPLILHPLFWYILPSLPAIPYFNPVASSTGSPTPLQTLNMALIFLHFFKRELETIFVHRFSATTMPVYNIFRNSAHYWILGGLSISLFTYTPSSAAAKHSGATFGETLSAPPYLALLGLILFVVGEVGNLQTHLVLKNLRPAGTSTRGIPQGVWFSVVTCPNYMFEVLVWIGVCLVNRSLSTVVFVVVAVAQMAAWAKKKERRYRKEFGDKYKRKRWTMLPGII